eukprot:g62057.t1
MGNSHQPLWTLSTPPLPKKKKKKKEKKCQLLAVPFSARFRACYTPTPQPRALQKPNNFWGKRTNKVSKSKQEEEGKSKHLDTTTDRTTSANEDTTTHASVAPATNAQTAVTAEPIQQTEYAFEPPQAPVNWTDPSESF